MTYLEYKKLVYTDLPSLRPLENAGLSAPEMLKQVAVELFKQRVNDGTLADATRKHLQALSNKGVHGFAPTPTADDPLGGKGITTGSGSKIKSGFNESEFV